MRRVQRLIEFCKARDRGTELPLLQSMQAEAWFIKKEDCILVLTGGFGEEDGEKRY